MVNESGTLYDQHYDEDNFYNKKGYNYIDRDIMYEYLQSFTQVKKWLQYNHICANLQ